MSGDEPLFALLVLPGTGGVQQAPRPPRTSKNVHPFDSNVH